MEFNKYFLRGFELHRKMMLDTSPYFKEEADITHYNQIVLTQLFTHLFSTGESVFLLVNNNSNWEADILLRTILEGTAKYLFMARGNLQRECSDINEYYEVIPEMQKIEDHKKASEALDVFKQFGINKHPFQLSILDDLELNRLEKKYPRNVRRELSKKWSYKNLLKDLGKDESVLDVLVTTLYTYSFSSHLIHFDGESTIQRTASLKEASEGNESVSETHSLRIISNIVSLAAIRVSKYIKIYQLSSDSLNTLLKESLKLIGDIEITINRNIDNDY